MDQVKTFAIPLRVDVRCHKYGWQIVALAADRNEGHRLFNTWVQDHLECSVKLLEVSGWQSWLVVDTYTGTRKYRR